MRRSIRRQVRRVVVCTVLLVLAFFAATANSVLTVDDASRSADRARAEQAVQQALAEGLHASNTLVRTIARGSDLRQARLAETGTLRPGEEAIPLTGNYVLAYVPRALGTETFHSLGLVRILIALLLVLSITLVLHRLNALARHIDSERHVARRLAELDPLTGISNRLHFNTCLAARIEAAALGEGRAALLLIDLDGFKAVNDSHGHVGGDRLLQQMAQRLVAHVAPGDLVARLGGDEFAIIREAAGRRQDLTGFADDLLRLTATPCVIDGTAVAVTASLGIACIEPGATDAEVLVRAADAALYRAKGRAGGGYEFAGPAPCRAATAPESLAA